MAVAMHDILQICFVGFSSQIAMAECVALFTHCRASVFSDVSLVDEQTQE